MYSFANHVTCYASAESNSPRSNHMNSTSWIRAGSRSEPICFERSRSTYALFAQVNPAASTFLEAAIQAELAV
jgi:hypothetical protein